MLKHRRAQARPYRKLYQLQLEKKSYDEAWCLAAALAFMRKADQEETQFFEDYRPKGMPAVRGRLDNEQWVRNLFHEEENLYVGKIFEMIAAAALKAKIESLKAKKEVPVLDPALPPGSGDVDRDARAHLRLGRAGARAPAVPAALRAQRRPRRARRGRQRAAGIGRRPDGAHRLLHAGSALHRAASTSRCTAASTTSRRSSRRSPS